MNRISDPIESKMQNKQPGATLLETDYLIVGSGYGGAVAAMRLANNDPELKREVVVLERGKEYSLGDFPYDIEDLPSHVRMLRPGHAPGGNSDALCHIHLGSEAPPRNPATTRTEDTRGKTTADVLVGSGLGGTSLINANVAEEPELRVFRKEAWPREIREMDRPLCQEFGKVRDRIGVTQHITHDGHEFPKYTALTKFCGAFDDSFAVRAAHIAVTDSTKTNGVGVKQAECTDCGNCVTGCNVGSKNTLDRNLLRLAKTRGAEFYTGATVSRIEPHNLDGYRWKIVVQPTVQPVGSVENETYYILAKNVILAAGALGSTEILLRSHEENRLEFSQALGKRFSTNGDGLIMSYGQAQPVGSIAEPEQKNPAKTIGPTITGIMRGKGLTFEEASVPAGIARLFSEVVTTSAMLQRMIDLDLPPLFDNSNRDPLAASMEVADHCQALLVMGDDGADGQLSLPEPNGALKITFPNSSIADNDALVRANELVKSQDRRFKNDGKDGLDGGQFAPNPLWKLVPQEAIKIFAGKMPARRALTVHPLGGCAMADTAAGGVVNHAGQVFKPDGSLHDGLYVMDGSIIPVSLEVNPFLTIAALAWRNSGLILQGKQESNIEKVSPAYAELGPVPERHHDRPQPTGFVIQEQLTGALDKLTPWFENENNLNADDQERIQQRDGLVVQVSTVNTQGETWLNNPGKSPLDAKMELYVNPLPLAMIEQFMPVGVTREHLRDMKPFLVLNGTFTILGEDEDSGSTLTALQKYIDRRGWSSLTLPDGDDSLWEKFKQGLNGIGIFHNLAVLQSRSRRLSYSFRDVESGIHISGDKVISYHREERLWPALLNLNLHVEEKGKRSAVELKVNVEYLLEPGLLEISKSANLPQSLLFAGGLAAYFARSVFVTNFWEFPALKYPKQTPKRIKPPALKIKFGRRIKPKTEVLPVPVREGGVTIPLLLTNYRRKGAKPILLIHGLAQGSQIFWTQGKKGAAAYFYKEGYDVWLLDYRLSTLVLPDLVDRNWSMDEIAEFDIAMAIEAVCTKTGSAQTSIFAHCVGASTFIKAALKVDGVAERIEAAVSNAIHPWVIGAPANRFRSKLGNFLREWVPERLLDPIPTEDNAGALQNVIDRLAYGLARLSEYKSDDHIKLRSDELVQGVCDRMTFLYSRMWNHKNLSKETHKAFVEMMGPAPLAVYQHLLYYNQLRRFTDRQGENTYLDRENIKNRWKFPILFVHGADSRVFNPHSARRSALRLREILANSDPELARKVHFRLFKGYGHMDVVFGKKAHEECFPKYLQFFNDTVNFPDNPDAMDWPEPYQAWPVTGPILRAAWIDKHTLRLRLRLWSELRKNVTDVPTILMVDGGTEVKQFEVLAPTAPPISKPRFRLLDVEIEDMKNEIELLIRGNILRYEDFSGAELSYDQQAWLLRLRAISNPPPAKSMRFLVGSSRYPGSIVDNTLSDQAYLAMHQHVSTADGVHLLFLIGDQIFAGVMEQLFDSDTPNSRFSEYYRRSFGSTNSPCFAQLVADIPTHFALDDREIKDNWSGLPHNAPQEDKDYAGFAIGTAQRFMSSGRDDVPILNPNNAESFHYGLAHPVECDFPAFVADTRTQRMFRQSSDPTRYDLFELPRYNALIRWLDEAHTHHGNSPKFIFSGSMIAPLPTRYCNDKSTWRQLDGWAGYPKTLEALLLHIVEKGISKVVFVGSGEQPSSVSKLELNNTTTGRAAVAWQIVSSGLYAPMPFATAHFEDFMWNTRHTLPTHVANDLTINCENKFLSDHYSQFIRVNATEQQVTVICLDESNAELKKEDLFW